MDVSSIRTILAEAPALTGFKPGSKTREEVLETLLKHGKQREVMRSSILPQRPVALRFILSGEIHVKRQNLLPGADGQLLGKGGLCGLFSVARKLGWQDPCKSPPEVATRDTLLLEVGCQDIPDMLQSWLQQVYAAQIQAPTILKTLYQEPRFAHLRNQDLLHILEGAYQVDPSSRILPRGTVPEDFYILLKGECRLEAGQLLTKLVGPACVAHKQFLLKRTIPGTFRVNSGAKLVCINGEHFNRLQKQDLELRRAILRSNPQLIPPPPTRREPYQLIVVRGDKELPLQELSGLLAERIAFHLHDHVLHIRLDERAGSQAPHPVLRLPKDKSHSGGWVSQWTVPFNPEAPWQQDQIYQLASHTSWLETTKGKVNVILVDISALPEQWLDGLLDSIVAAEVPTQARIRLIHVSRSAEALSTLPPPPEGVHLIPTGVLLDEGPQERPERLSRVRQKLSTAAKLFSANSDSTQPWPMGTVRLRIPGAWLRKGPPTTLEDHQQKDDSPSPLESFERWARAATGRRVGLVLGGGGAYGAVHLALIEKLYGLDAHSPHTPQRQVRPAERIPVDLVSGASVGTMIGTYFCVVGPEKLRTYVLRDVLLLTAATALGTLSSVGVQLWVDYSLNAKKLQSLDIPLFPVTTDAGGGVEWDIRQGTVGMGVQASGALPPIMGPALFGNRRLVDGGIAANVPVDILRVEGADLLIISNPISRVPPEPRYSSQGMVDRLMHQLNPLQRIHDTSRMLTIMGRLAGSAQTAGQSLIYAPKYNSAKLFAVNEFQQIADEAAKSLELNQLVLEARQKWRALLNNPPSLLEWKSDTEAALVLHVLFEGDSLTASSEELLDELVTELQQSNIDSFELVVGTPNEASSMAQAKAVQHYLEEYVPQKITGARADSSPDSPNGRVRLLNVVKVDESHTKAAHIAELRNKHLADKEEELRESKDPRFKDLLAIAEWECREGDLLDAARNALEAAEMSTAPEVDEILRAVLQRKGLEVRRYDNQASATCFALGGRENQYLAVGGKDGWVRLWIAGQTTPSRESVDYSMDPNINALVWSPTGDLLVACDNNGAVTLWSVSPAGLTRRPGGGPVGNWDTWGLAFSPDGRLLLGPRGERQAAIFSLENEALVLLSRIPERVLTAAWAPGESSVTFATLGEDKVRIRRLGEENPATFEVPGGSTLAWKPDAQTLAVGGGNGVRLISLNPGIPPLPDTLSTAEAVSAVAWSPRGDWLVAGTVGGLLYIWDPQGEQSRLRVQEHGSLRLCFHPSREELLIWSDERASIWDLRSGRRIALLSGHTGTITQARWSSDGARVYTSSTDETVREWELSSGGIPLHSWTAPELTGWRWYTGNQPLAVEHPRNDRDASPSWVSRSPDGKLSIVPVRTAEGIEVVPWSEGQQVPEWAQDVFVHWSPDSSMAAIRAKTQVSLWDAKTGSLKLGPEERYDIRSLCWHPQSSSLAYGTTTVTYLNGEAQPQKKQAPRSDWIWSIDWHPAGHHIAIGCNTSTAHILSSPGGALELSLRHPFPVECVAWSPTGQVLATGDRSGVVRIWASDGQDLAGSSQVRRRPICKLVWSRTGAHLLSVDETGRALIWEEQAGQWRIMAVLEHEPFKVRWAAFGEPPRAMNDKQQVYWAALMGMDGKLRLHPVHFTLLRDLVAQRFSVSGGA
jgi:WD40 repeat protein/predicted acylesterase/phospholipase RssA